MTVDELLRALSGAFRAFDGQALEAWAPAFRKQLARHEGRALGEAYVAVLANFKPGPRQAFAMPADFAAHLPGQAPRAESSSSAPALDLAQHASRKAGLMATWRQRQRPLIAKARGEAVARACEWEALELAHERAWSASPPEVVLTDAQIELCEQRAVSQERLREFGATVLAEGRGDLWREQMAAARAALRGP